MKLGLVWTLVFAGSLTLAVGGEMSQEPGVPWPATDDLGRSLPMSEDVGLPRPDRFVGVFYFLTHGRHGHRGPFDNSRILAEHPDALENPRDPLWGPVGAGHHWGEPLFGYYVSEDESVLRKHAQMLADAGVDVIIFDVSNQRTYPESYVPLCRVFEKIRAAGGHTPQIAFLCPFWSPQKVVRELWEQLYRPGLYSNLWFRWQGKPLILADPQGIAGQNFGAPQIAQPLEPGHTLGESFSITQPLAAVRIPVPTWMHTNSGLRLTLFRVGPRGAVVASRQFKNIQDNAQVQLDLPKSLPRGRYYLEASAPENQVGWWSDTKRSIPHGQAWADGQPVAGERNLTLVPSEPDPSPRNFFTFRKPQADYFSGPTGPNEWGWLEISPQHVFTNASGAAEEMTVGVAQNAVDGKLSVLSNPHSHGRSFHDGAEPPPGQRDFSGRNFADQWKRALAVDPPFIFITGWNEWTAIRFGRKSPFYGHGPVSFVDQFDEEFSRDIEPMRGGHGDDYYYQMVANIRRYKGAPAIPPVRPRPIRIDGQFADWTGVEPEFLDTPGDPVHRSSRGYGEGSHYKNKTGRNDIIAAKVSYDATNIYFYARTRKTLTSHRGSNWVLLFIDADHNPRTGWLGYDFVVNRDNVTSHTTTIERNLGGYHWSQPETIDYRTRRNELELTVPRATLGLTNLPATIDFKWADNIQQIGDASDFTLNGDTAPNDRFNFRAILSREK